MVGSGEQEMTAGWPDGEGARLDNGPRTVDKIGIH